MASLTIASKLIIAQLQCVWHLDGYDFPPPEPQWGDVLTTAAVQLISSKKLLENLLQSKFLRRMMMLEVHG